MTKKARTNGVRKGVSKQRRGRVVRLRRGDGPPFGPEFFLNVLPQMVLGCGCTEHEEPRVLVHLGDGTHLDVHKVVGIGERFVVLSAFGEGPGEDGIERTSDDLIVEAIPFDLVLRVSVTRIHKNRQRRLGFASVPPSMTVTTKTASKAEGEPAPKA